MSIEQQNQIRELQRRVEALENQIRDLRNSPQTSNVRGADLTLERPTLTLKRNS